MLDRLDDVQDAACVEEGDTDKSDKLLVARTLPHADHFPNTVPERQQNDDRYQQREAYGEVMGFDVNSREKFQATPASSANRVMVR
jgi:hypothetical protein